MSCGTAVLIFSPSYYPASVKGSVRCSLLMFKLFISVSLGQTCHILAKSLKNIFLNIKTLLPRVVGLFNSLIGDQSKVLATARVCGLKKTSGPAAVGSRLGYLSICLHCLQVFLCREEAEFGAGHVVGESPARGCTRENMRSEAGAAGEPTRGDSRRPSPHGGSDKNGFPHDPRGENSPSIPPATRMSKSVSAYRR